MYPRVQPDSLVKDYTKKRWLILALLSVEIEILVTHQVTQLYINYSEVLNNGHLITGISSLLWSFSLCLFLHISLIAWAFSRSTISRTSQKCSFPDQGIEFYTYPDHKNYPDQSIQVQYNCSSTLYKLYKGKLLLFVAVS